MLANDDGLRDKHRRKDEKASQGDEEDLDVESKKTAPSGLAESGPRIRDGSIALAANDLGLDLTLKGAVEWNNSVELNGQQRSLNTNEDDTGRDDEEDGANDGDDGDNNALGDHGTSDICNIHGLSETTLRHLEADRQSEGNGHKARDLSSEPEQSDSLPGSIKGSAERGQARPEVQRRLLRDDNVYPGSAELDEGQRGEQRGNGHEELSEGTGENPHQDGGQGRLGCGAEETAKVGLEAAVGHEQAVDGAEGRGNRASLAVCRLETVAGDAIFGVVGGGFAVIERKGLVGGRVLVLDHGEDGVDALEGVVDLDVC